MDIFLASLPILTLIILMGVFKMPGDRSSVITLIVTALVAAFGFSFPAIDISFSFLYGMGKALFPILFIILMAIYSYNVLLQTGKIDVLREQFSNLAADRSVQVLLITWGFGGLLEGMAGFGTAVAIPAAILISLGYKPVFSALVSLLANSVPTAFGAVGVPVIVLSQETGLPLQHLSVSVVIQLSALMILIPMVITFLTDSSGKALWKNLTLSILVGIVSIVVQYVTARYIGAETPAILGAIASIAVIIGAGKFIDRKKPRSKSHLSAKETLSAWSVYGLILVLVLITSPLIPAVRNALSSVCVTTFPFVIQGYAKPLTIQWLTQGGILLFLGSFLGGLIQGASVGSLFTCLSRTVVQMWRTAVTVICLVGFSTIMEVSGMTPVLAIALATATGSLYPLFAPAIGALGTFLTGSDTSANIMFGKLQASVGTQIGVSPDWLAAANTAGATGGKIISPQSIAIATSACNDQGREGAILKRALPYALAYVIITGLAVYIFA